MALYFVDVDVTTSVQMWLDAKNEDEAKTEAIKEIERTPVWFAQSGCFVEAKVTDCYIDE